MWNSELEIKQKQTKWKTNIFQFLIPNVDVKKKNIAVC